MTAVYVLATIFLGAMTLFHLLGGVVNIVCAIQDAWDRERDIAMAITFFVFACFWGTGLAYTIWKLTQ